MDDKKIALIASTVSIVALAIVIAAFLWHRSSSEQTRVIMENGTAGSPQEDQAVGKSAPKESTSAIVTDVEHTQSPPKTKASGGEKPENIVHLSLPDPIDTASDRSAEKFGSDEDDEEDTDDGITIETEPDDE